MNAIFAYTGDRPCRELLWQGLLRCSEGDLAGVTVQTEKGLAAAKAACSQQELAQRCRHLQEDGTAGLAAACTALQAQPMDITAPPYAEKETALALDGTLQDDSRLLTAVSSGDNRSPEALWLRHLMSLGADGCLQALRRAAGGEQVSTVLLSAKDNCLYCRSGVNPLYIGVAEHGFFVTNELSALPEDAVRFYLLRDGEGAKLTAEHATLLDARLRKIKKPLLSTETALLSAAGAPPSPFACPLAVKACIAQYISGGTLNREALPSSKKMLLRCHKAILAGSGEAYAAACLAAHRFPQLTDMDAVAHETGALLLDNPLMDRNTLVIVLSGGGKEDGMTAVLQRAARLGAPTVAVTESRYFPIALLADEVLTIPAGSGVIGAYLALTFFMLYIGSKSEILSDVYLSVTVQLAEMLAGKVSAAIKAVPPVQRLSGRLIHADTVITAGIGADAAVAEEAAATLRRTLRVPAFRQSLYSLVSESRSPLGGLLVLSFLTDPAAAPETLRLLRRLHLHGAEVLLVTTESIESDLTDELPVIAYPDSLPLFNPVICLSGLQKVCASAQELLQAKAV